MPNKFRMVSFGAHSFPVPTICEICDIEFREFFYMEETVSDSLTDQNASRSKIFRIYKRFNSFTPDFSPINLSWTRKIPVSTRIINYKILQPGPSSGPLSSIYNNNKVFTVLISTQYITSINMIGAVCATREALGYKIINRCHIKMKSKKYTQPLFPRSAARGRMLSQFPHNGTEMDSRWWRTSQKRYSFYTYE